MALGGAVVAGGCASTGGQVEPTTHPRGLRLERHGLAVEFVPEIDRITYFGMTGRGEAGNLLFVTGLDRPPAPDGYVFYGGCYTWTAPQKPAAGLRSGWVAPDGGSKDWPPDPAMDVGPVRTTGQSQDGFTFTGPQQRTGLREVKRWRMREHGTAELEFSLENVGTDLVAAGPWINTAAGQKDVLALRMPEGTEVYGWDQRSIDSFRSVLSGPMPGAEASGWRTIDLSRATWEGGIKVYLAPPSGQGVKPEIAVWRRGARAWLHRSATELSAAQVAGLREAGEGPVAVYIQPGRDGSVAIIEAELYGAIETLTAGQATGSTELWRAVPSERPDPTVLDAPTP
jgi:hypothetical protein